jgi:plasmid stability protein
MSSIKIENIPDRLLKRLKASAAVNHTSIEKEVLMCIEKTLMGNNKNKMSSSEKAFIVIDQLGLSYKGSELKKYMESCL